MMDYDIIFDRKGWLLWSCLFFIPLFFANAQVIRKDRVKIKGMGTVRGTVLSYDPTKEISVLLMGGDTLTMSADRVVRVGLYRALDIPEKGAYWHSAELGRTWGRSGPSSETAVYSYLETNHAYVVNRYLQPGMGVAYQKTDDFILLPFFLSLTGHITDSRVAPFYYANIGRALVREKAGSGIPSNALVAGGWMWHTGGGIRIAGKRNSIYLKVGYKVQYIKMETKEDLSTISPPRSLHIDSEKISRTIQRGYIGVSFSF